MADTYFVRALSEFPDGDPDPVGLLLLEGDDGELVTTVADVEWVRLAADGAAVGHDVHPVEVPESVWLPVVMTGWPEDWGPAEHSAIDDVALQIREADTWDAFRRAFLVDIGDEE